MLQLASIQAKTEELNQEHDRCVSMAVWILGARVYSVVVSGWMLCIAAASNQGHSHTWSRLPPPSGAPANMQTKHAHAMRQTRCPAPSRPSCGSGDAACATRAASHVRAGVRDPFTHTRRASTLSPALFVRFHVHAPPTPAPPPPPRLCSFCSRAVMPHDAGARLGVKLTLRHLSRRTSRRQTPPHAGAMCRSRRRTLARPRRQAAHATPRHP